MHGVLQRYAVRLGTVPEATAYAEASLLPLLRQVPGFAGFCLLTTDDNALACLALVETREGADVVERVMRDWFRVDWPSFRLLAPELGVSQVVAYEGIGRVATAGTLAAALRVERRVSVDRRVTAERRQRFEAQAVERRSGPDRRANVERRTGLHGQARWRPPHLRIAPPWKRRQQPPSKA